MAQLPPEWSFRIYSKLWIKFNEQKFSNEQAKKVVKDLNLTQAISRLKKDGWIKISLNPQDSRKSLYALNKPEDTLKSIIEEYSNEK